ncbi:MAG: hypothetical protein ABI480_17750 [Chitinophagaceae bacterium]
MNYNDIIGSSGVGLILLAYFANIFSLIPQNGKLFYAANIVGSTLACYASFLISYWPFVIMEGVWALGSLAGLIKVYKK